MFRKTCFLFFLISFGLSPAAQTKVLTNDERTVVYDFSVTKKR